MTQVVVTVMPKAGVLDPQGQAVAGRAGAARVRRRRRGADRQAHRAGDRRRRPRGPGPRDVRAAARERADRGLLGSRSPSDDGRRRPLPRVARPRERPRARSRASGRARWRPGTPTRSSRRAPTPCCSRRLLLRRPPALRGHRQPRAGDGRRAPPRRGRRPGGGDLQRLPGAVRGGPAAGGAAAQRDALVRLPPDGARGGRRRHAVDRRPRRRRRISIPIKNNEGAWYGDPSAARVVLRYREDLLGSTDRVAGIASADGNVMGLMPHPEEACDPLLGSTDGGLVLDGAARRGSATDAPPPPPARPHRRRGGPHPRAARPRAQRPRAGHVQPDVERALLLQAQPAAPARLPHRRARACCRARAKRRRGGRGRRPRRGAEDREPQPPSAVEPFEGRRPAWAASCATSSRWARGRSPCSTRCASASCRAPRSRHLFTRSVAGIGHYGNCIGVPTVGGEVAFDDRYEESCLVNAMCVGVRGARTGCCGPPRRGRATRWC